MTGQTRMAQRSGSFDHRLPPQPASVGMARHLVRGLLAEAGRDDLTETATLAVSEIVTNALLHAGTQIHVVARVDDDGLRCEVGDGSLHLPVLRRYGATSGTGRGLRMVDQLVDEWGVTPHPPTGKTVWFQMSDGDGDSSFRPLLPGEAADGLRAEEARYGHDVAIDLHSVPLLLHAAWQEHAEALLREYLLASLDDDEGDIAAIQVHADATDAIAILEEQIPRVDVDVEPDKLMEGATEPHVSLPRLTLNVPIESVPHFDVLDGAIDAALDLSRRGLTLTPPTQPELRMFRHWLCRQVIEQASGGVPVPWTVEGEPEPIVRGEVVWDLESVATAQTGLIVADDANLILAVSPPALQMLGYDDTSGLVGRRLIAIIPERFRQAHVAGFTMYQLAGRKPLLGQTITVPALRRDGDEVDVQLLIEAHPVGGGRSVFTAAMSPVEPPAE